MLGELVRDDVCRGLLSLWQPKDGYRFNLDGILLGALGSALAEEGPIVDVGAGGGVVGLYVRAVTGKPVILVERVTEVAELARKNAGDACVLRADFRALPFLDRSVSLLLCNPPYLTPGTGRSSPHEHKRLSREAIHGGARDVLQEAARVLRDDGKAVIITPRAIDAPAGLHRTTRVELLRKEGGPLERVLGVYQRALDEDRSVQKALHQADGTYSEWVRDILEGRTRQWPP